MYVAEALRWANSLHMQRVGHPAVLSTRFDPAFVSDGGAAFEEASARLNALDFHPSLGPSVVSETPSVWPYGQTLAREYRYRQS
jgi:hypothetical protein